MSNLCDWRGLGPLRPLMLFGPLLQNPYDNPHASIIALFMDALMETEDCHNVTPDRANLNTTDRYLILRKRIATDPFGVGMLIAMAAVPFGADVEKIFNK